MKKNSNLKLQKSKAHSYRFTVGRVLQVAVALVFLVFTARFLYIGISKTVNGQNLSQRTKQLYKRNEVIKASRGTIYDCNGLAIAEDSHLYTVYAILDKMQMQSFIDWAERNGINKITTPDDLSKDSAANLIMMFEQIYQAKKNEIFISMQFGDSQSELIYEKITRAIERFNEKHKSIRLNATPIRIDRTVESSTFSIQDRILEAIKSCSLIIADLSSSNINVYHEIGYAMGVAESHNMIPNMILLYKEDTDHNKERKDVDKFVGFNLRNLSQLRFKDYKQLVDGLVDRLEKHYGV